MSRDSSLNNSIEEEFYGTSQNKQRKSFDDFFRRPKKCAKIQKETEPEEVPTFPPNGFKLATVISLDLPKNQLRTAEEVLHKDKVEEQIKKIIENTNMKQKEQKRRARKRKRCSDDSPSKKRFNATI